MDECNYSSLKKTWKTPMGDEKIDEKEARELEKFYNL